MKVSLFSKSRSNHLTISFKVRSKGNKSLQRNVLSIVSFKANRKPYGEKWNAKEMNSKEKNANQAHFNC